MYYEDTDLCFQAARTRTAGALRAAGHRHARRGRDGRHGRQPGRTSATRSSTARVRRQVAPRGSSASTCAGLTNVRPGVRPPPGPHVLIVDHRVATWDRDAGSQRMLGIINGLLAEGATSPSCRTTSRHPAVHAALQRLGVRRVRRDRASGELAAIGAATSAGRALAAAHRQRLARHGPRTRPGGADRLRHGRPPLGA